MVFPWGRLSQIVDDKTKAISYIRNSGSRLKNAELHKLNKWYENMKASIHEWEKENKVRAKVKMERRKKELEKKIKMSHQVYQLKISRIDDIAGGARAQVDDKRRNEELKIKEKAKQIRATGVVPFTCLCF
ncbi:hypothetical protein CXB51_009169 [Gossypium anomalum]|uniref:Remorin C-terminal domain-containing protein n=1 Tax=Gossypium anomalum TaxID=47600 RepID=A0A8J5YYT9_9ROSI|nr:hypothetical protein CXB51_009169 [Gossypium anomalum]